MDVEACCQQRRWPSSGVPVEEPMAVPSAFFISQRVFSHCNVLPAVGLAVKVDRRPVSPHLL